MELRTSEKGLSNEDAEKDEEFGPNEVSAQKANPSNKMMNKNNGYEKSNQRSRIT